VVPAQTPEVLQMRQV